MRIFGNLSRWFGITALCGTTIVSSFSGCGGGDSSIIGDDGGSSSSSGSSSGASSSSSGSGGPIDAGPDVTLRGDSAVGGDSTTGNDSPTGSDSTTGTDSPAGADSTTGSDSPTGGDSMTGTDSAPRDSSGDSMTNGDAADANDSSTRSDAADANMSCTGQNTKCNDTGAMDLCKSGVCSGCVSTTDDAHCTAAYGSASNPYLCLAGSCAAGDCRSNGDCTANPNGTLCGVLTPHLCGKCNSDQQCAGNANGTVCEIQTGQCVIGTCAIDAGVSAGGVPGTCTVNASDICCTGTCQPSAGANACCPGPNAAAYCATKIGGAHAACANNVCTECPLIPGGPPNYWVDPVGGSDLGGTGDRTTAGCAFKTITRALQVIGGSPLVATTVTVLGPSTVNAGETFPLALPTNVTVTTSGGAVQVDVPAGASGFVLRQADSAIQGGTTPDGGAPPTLTIRGSHAGVNDATSGIVVDTGGGVSTANAPNIANLILTSFGEDGILVQNGGILRIGPGLTSTLNGLATRRRAGLHVTGAGKVIVDVGAGAAPAHFDQNTNHGIEVDTSGSISITGTVTDAITGTGTVTTSGNYAAGIWIQQTGGTPPLNDITGLVSFANTNGNGIRLFAGSSVRMRRSVSLGNQGDGVLVSASVGGSNDISQIDLGTAVDAGGSFGLNTFQQALGSANNGAAGICLQVNANTGSLRAAGNIFRAIHCDIVAGALTVNAGACDNAACAGGVCDLGIVNATGNDIDVSMCTP